MKRLAITAAAALLLTLTGCGVTAEPKAMTTVNATPAADIQEDEPGWDCKTMGNRLCGANPIERVEAWGKFQTSSVSKDVLREAFRVTYMGTAMPGIDFPPSTYVTIPSSITLNTVHVFMIEPGVTQ